MSTRNDRGRAYFQELTRPRDGLPAATADLAIRAAILALLVWGLFALATWSGKVVSQPGGWLALDLGMFQALNALPLGPLTGFLLALLNEPGPNYFALILVILGYCWFRRRALLPAAALAIAVTLGLGLMVTREMHQAGGGGRERPFLALSEARTPITDCSGVGLLAMRTADGPTALCVGQDGNPIGRLAAAAAGQTPDAGTEVVPADINGLDWREIWTKFATFPSGHLREVAALCLLLVVFWPASWPYALTYALVMAFSRVHLGAHYPSDVLAGTLLGLWSAGITLFGLALLQRLLLYLHRVPALGGAWDWVFQNQVAGHPESDPPLARALRAGAYLIAANLAVLALGYVITDSGASHLHSVLQNADVWARGAFSAPLDAALGSLLSLLLGPVGLVLLLVSGALLGALARERAMPTLATLAVALAVGLEFGWLGARLFPRRPPLLEAAESLGSPDWLAGWSGYASFPGLPVLLLAALAAVLACTWPRAAIPAHLAALAAGLGLVWLGGAWLTDALAGYLLGNLAALLARQLVAQVGLVAAEETASPPAKDEATPWPGAAPTRPTVRLGEGR